MFWDQTFAKPCDQAAVRQTARELMQDKKFDQVIAMIEAALRHGQPQSWMYESLGIAMELDGRSKAEIERVVMSAADFATTPDELMYIASYLSRSGLDRRALQLCQQVVKIQPLRREAYALGLRSAQRMRRSGRHPVGDGRRAQPGLAEERNFDRKDRDSNGSRHARPTRKRRSRRRVRRLSHAAQRRDPARLRRAGFLDRQRRRRFRSRRAERLRLLAPRSAIDRRRREPRATHILSRPTILRLS